MEDEKAIKEMVENQLDRFNINDEVQDYLTKNVATGKSYTEDEIVEELSR